MSRKIKFRAWHIEQKRMFDVYGLGIDFITENTFDGLDYGTNAFCDDDMNFIEIMQYSLLKDKNEKEIFEGDIIDIHQTVNGCSKFVLLSCIGGYDVRYFIDGSYSMPYEYDVNELLDVEVEDKEIEIVGNIYQYKSDGKET